MHTYIHTYIHIEIYRNTHTLSKWLNLQGERHMCNK